VGLGALVGGAVRLWFPANPGDWLPLLAMLAALPALAWTEWRRLGTSYHVTNLRLVLRTSVPRRTELAVRYADLVDLDTQASAWPDTGTLIPVTARTPLPAPLGLEAEDAGPAPHLRFVGVRPFGRVRALVEVLAQRATASETMRSESALDAQVAEALAALHRP
jgi:hypothetical protein